jgi:hypothetical protein
MNTTNRLVVIAVVFANLLILLYMNFTSDMQLLSHLVLIPALMLESIAVGGFLLEKRKPSQNTLHLCAKAKPQITERARMVKPAA